MPNDLSNGFKETELGPLPGEWEVVRLGEVATRAFGGGTPSTKKADFWDGPIPWTTTAVIGEDDIYLKKFQRGITEKAVQHSSTRVAHKGSILIGTRVGVGKAVVASFDVAINQDITAIVLSARIVPEFLVLYLKNLVAQRWFIESKRGTTIKGIPRKDVLSYPIALLSIDEQRAIVHVLSSIQKTVEVQDKIITALELKKSLMRHLFTYGPMPLDQADQVPLKETEIGSVPEYWEVRRLEEVATIERGKFAHRPRNDPHFYGGSIPFIQTGDVAKAGGHITTYSQTLNELGLSVSRVFPKGTIVLTIAANIGDTGSLNWTVRSQIVW
jgi:type I restriction enzyme, S subunit